MAKVITFTFMTMLFAFQTAQYAAILFLGAKTRMPQKQARDGLFACSPDFRPPPASAVKYKVDSGSALR
jgi:hypothetical protein